MGSMSPYAGTQKSTLPKPCKKMSRLSPFRKTQTFAVTEILVWRFAKKWAGFSPCPLRNTTQKQSAEGSLQEFGKKCMQHLPLRSTPKINSA
jgi:hypothetical protein